MIGEELVLYADLIKSGGFSCASIEYCAYRYRVNEGSLMNRFDLKLERQQLLSWDMLCDVARGFFPSLTRDGGFAQARMRLAFLDKLITKGLERTSDYEQVSWWLKENRSTVFGNSRFSLGRRASFEVFLVCPPLYRLLVKRRFSWQEK